MTRIGKMLDSSFPAHLHDAVHFDELAETLALNAAPKANTCAKASLISCVFALEAAANCCLFQVPENKRKVAKGKTIEGKFRFLYRLSSGNELPESDARFLPITELRQLRNRYVHPLPEEREVLEIPLEVTLGPAGIQGKFVNKPLEPTTTAVLGLPSDPDHWYADVSSRAIRETVTFLNYFFLDLLGFSAKMASNFIFLHGPSGGDGYLEIHHIEAFRRIEARYGVKPRFLDLERFAWFAAQQGHEADLE